MDQDNLRGFKQHGVDFSQEVGNQAVGNCPFCSRENKFYANAENKLWDCKVCMEKGNFEDFLAKIAQVYQSSITKADLQRLAENRGLPVEAFEGLNIGYDKDNERYCLPIYSPKLRVTDLRMFKLGGRLMSTPTVKTGLYQITELLVGQRKDDPIYLCEGEWDCIAWRWLLKKAEKPGVVVGTPGAGTFKEEWSQYFDKRIVYVLYDNDQAGIDGEVKVHNRIGQLAKQIWFLHWPEDLETGYDIRDLVKSFAVVQAKPKKTYKLIHESLSQELRSKAKVLPDGTENTAQTAPETSSLEPISVEELFAEYRKWLHLPNPDPLIVMYGTLIANKMQGDPVWLFLVAPPGGSKSELLMSLSDSDYIHALTSLTPHTLISGAYYQDGKDPSLLPQLHKRILVVKDFTTILTMHYSVRDEIFGVLRDAYDGSIEKAFGNGIKRRYNIQFGVLAGVTPTIETFNEMHQSLGERFLKFRISGNWEQLSEEEKIRRAIQNNNRETAMRDQLKKAAARYLKYIELPDPCPELTKESLEWTIHLAKFAARLRGVVPRDKYNGHIQYKPSSEVPTRLAKQFTKLGAGISIFLGEKTIGEKAYRLMRRCALDTVPDKAEDIVRALWEWHEKNTQEFCLTRDIIGITRLSQSTVFRCLEDLTLLRIVDKSNSTGVKSMWRLSAYMKDLIVKGRIYDRSLGVSDTKKENGNGTVKLKFKVR